MNDYQIPSVQVQMYFQPELIQPGQNTELVVRLVPKGEYQKEHFEALKEWNLEICVSFDLPGFTYKSDHQNISGGEAVPSAIFTYLGQEIEKKIQLVAGERVSGTDYSEMIFINNSLKYRIRDGGHFAPGAEGYYLRRPGQSGDYPIIPLFKK